MASRQVRKYFVKMSWIFNLESMHDMLHCIIYDIEDGIINCPVEIAGTICNDIDDIYKLMDEAERLEWTAKSGRVTGKEYGRIKEIVNWRVMQRYMTCVASGMSDNFAGACFDDL